eukprot:COSAG03_NODE_2394_length_2814_cov_15.603315_3_plen_122_part_00
MSAPVSEIVEPLDLAPSAPSIDACINSDAVSKSVSLKCGSAAAQPETTSEECAARSPEAGHRETQAVQPENAGSKDHAARSPAAVQRETQEDDPLTICAVVSGVSALVVAVVFSMRRGAQG